MSWQTPYVIENGRVSAWHKKEIELHNQYVTGEKVFAIAPMIDWTDEK